MINNLYTNIKNIKEQIFLQKKKEKKKEKLRLNRSRYNLIQLILQIAKYNQFEIDSIVVKFNFKRQMQDSRTLDL